jgi:hypothetical protein
VDILGNERDERFPEGIRQTGVARWDPRSRIEVAVGEASNFFCPVGRPIRSITVSPFLLLSINQCLDIVVNTLWRNFLLKNYKQFNVHQSDSNKELHF